MNKTDTLIIWFGGVLAPSLESLIFSYVEDLNKRKMQTSGRAYVYGLIDKFRLQKMNEQDFFIELSNICGLEINPENYYPYMTKGIDPGQELVGLLINLKPVFSYFYLSDWPESWLNQIKAKQYLQEKISFDKIIYRQDLSLDRLVPDIFYRSLQKINRDSSNCIFIDINSTRTSAAVRIGLNSIIYSDTFCLQRELSLRKLLD